jgi:hypothetical protein
MQLVVTLQTTERIDDSDDGMRRVYARAASTSGLGAGTSLKDAIADAVRRVRGTVPDRRRHAEGRVLRRGEDQPWLLRSEAVPGRLHCRVKSVDVRPVGRVEASEAVQKMIDRGLAMPVQSNVKAGHITFEFLGGTLRRGEDRLPPFVKCVTFQRGDVHVGHRRTDDPSV